jgi:hypothetical protein
MVAKLRGFTKIVLFVGLFLAVPNAYAHRPETGNADGVTLIADPNTSYAYYRELVGPGDLHAYQFVADAGRRFHAGINIPQLERLEGYGVSLALLGPGLPPVRGEDEHSRTAADGHDHGGAAHENGLERSSLVADLALEADGGLLVESETSEVFFEPFTQTRYWGRQMIDLELPRSGTYYLVVWQPEGETGKYVLDTGRDEFFGPADLVRFPIWWINTRVYFEQTSQLAGGFVLLMAAAAGLVVYRRRR